jgi:hypothetical protein
LEGDHDFARERLLGDIRLLLYLREMGAENLLVFVRNQPPCEVHLAEHAQEAGLDPVLARLDDLAAELLPDAKIKLRRHEDHYDYSFIHPRFEHTQWGGVWSDADDAALAREVARAVLKRYTAHTSDVRTARTLGLPLGSTVRVHGDLLGLTPEAPSPAQVLFNLKLPVLPEVSVRELIELRESEREYFDRFRSALRTAATERLASDRNEDAAAAATAIEQEIIQPALQDIELRLRAADDTLAAEKRTSTPLAALLTACGVYVSEPLLITAGIAAGAATVQAAFKHAEDVGDVRLSDMFFLWQAQHRH